MQGSVAQRQAGLKKVAALAQVCQAPCQHVNHVYLLFLQKKWTLALTEFAVLPLVLSETLDKPCKSLCARRLLDINKCSTVLCPTKDFNEL